MSFSTSRLQVKYREKYISTLGTWKSIPDRPEFFFNKVVNENVSNVSTVDSPGQEWRWRSILIKSHVRVCF